MPPYQYYNQAAPFWDFIANLEEQGRQHPWFANNNEANTEGNENQQHPNPWAQGWGGFPFGGPFPHRFRPGPPRYHRHGPPPPPTGEEVTPTASGDEKDPEVSVPGEQDPSNEKAGPSEKRGLSAGRGGRGMGRGRGWGGPRARRAAEAEGTVLFEQPGTSGDETETSRKRGPGAGRGGRGFGRGRGAGMGPRARKAEAEGEAGPSEKQTEESANEEASGSECKRGPGAGRRGHGMGHGRGRGGPHGMRGRGGPHGMRGHHHGPHGPHGPHRGPPGGFQFGNWARMAQQFQKQLLREAGLDNENEDFSPEVDVFDTTDSYVVHVSLPGAAKEDVAVTWDAEKSLLNISGVVHRPGDEELLKTLAQDERKVGAFERKVRLGSRANPTQVDVEAITARMENGVLSIDVPKLDSEYVEVKKVDIE